MYVMGFVILKTATVERDGVQATLTGDFCESNVEAAVAFWFVRV